MQALYTEILRSLEAASLGNKEGEAALQRLSFQPGYTLCMGQATIQKESVPPHIRQLAAILLRQFVDEQWVRKSPSERHQALLQQKRARERDFRESVEEFDAAGSQEREIPVIGVQEAEKVEVRKVLLQALCLPEASIRGTAALACASAARYDIPDAWPELLPFLQQQITGAAGHGQEGAMLCFEMIMHPDCLPNDVLEHLLPSVLPFAFQVYQNTATAVRVRRRCVSVFFSLVNWIANYRVEVAGGGSEVGTSKMLPLLLSALPQWMQQFALDLSATSRDELTGNHTGLKIVILQVCSMLVYSLLDEMLTHGFLVGLLGRCWTLMQALVPVFMEGIVSCDALSESDEVDFNCGDSYSFENLVMMVLEVFHATLNKDKSKPLLENLAPQLIHFLAYFGQLTAKQLQEYSTDEDQFAVDEQAHYGAHSLSIRVSSAKLASELIRSYQSSPQTMAMIIKTFQDMIAEGDATRAERSQTDGWWRAREGVLHTLCKTVKFMAPTDDRRRKAYTGPRFPVGDFLPFLFLDLEENLNPFLRGRALDCASICAQVMEGAPAQVGGQDPRIRFFEVAAKAMASQGGFPLRIGACKALKKFCALADEATMRQVVSYLIGGLCAFVPQVSAETLHLVLDTFISILRSASRKCHDALVPLTEPIGACVMGVWTAYSQDAFLNSYVPDIFHVLLLPQDGQGLSQSQCSVLEKQCIPAILSVIQNPELLSEKITALELLDKILSAAARTEPPALSHGLVRACIPMLLQFLNSDACSNEYDSIFDSSCKLFLSCLLHVKPASGTWAEMTAEQLQQHAALLSLQELLQFCSKLLAPDVSEMAVMKLGTLLCVAIARFSSILSALLLDVLVAVSQRLLTVRMTDMQQSLTTVVARIMLMDPVTAAQRLASAPACTNGQQSLLEAVLQQWCAKQSEFYGKYCIAATMGAFCRMLESNHPQLLQVVVPGDRTGSSRYSLRSSRRQQQQQQQQEEWSKVPLQTKLLKLLLNHHCQLQEAGAIDELDGLDGDDGDFFDISDEDYDEDDDDFYLGDDDFDDEEGLGMDELAEEDIGTAMYDKTLLQMDPAVAGSLKERLFAFFHQAKAGTLPAVVAAAQQLSPMEQQTLSQV